MSDAHEPDDAQILHSLSASATQCEHDQQGMVSEGEKHPMTPLPPCPPGSTQAQAPRPQESGHW